MPIDQPEPYRLLADQFDIDAAAVIGDHDDDLGAIARQTDGDSTHIRLAQGGAALRGLDAVDHGVAQHVLQRRHQAFQHLAIQLGRSPLHHQFGALAGVVGRLAHQTRQALYVALERHHARSHQAVLQFSDDPRLPGQQVLCLAGERLQ